MVAYLEHGEQGFSVMCRPAQEIVTWLELYVVTIMARYVLEKESVLADQLSRYFRYSHRLSLLLQAFKGIWKENGCPHIALFATRANMKLPIYVLPIPDPMAWKQDSF